MSRASEHLNSERDRVTARVEDSRSENRELRDIAGRC